MKKVGSKTSRFGTAFAEFRHHRHRCGQWVKCGKGLLTNDAAYQFYRCKITKKDLYDQIFSRKHFSKHLYITTLCNRLHKPKL